MKVIIASFVLIFIITITSVNSNSETFEKISETGFGDVNNRYAWSMCEFTPDLDTPDSETAEPPTFLYVGTKNKARDKTAEIYRMDVRTEVWENVTPDFDIYNQGVRALVVYENESGKALYAGTVNRTKGCLVYRTFNGTDWEPVSLPKFGTDARITCNSVRGCAVIGDFLYMGTMNDRRYIHEAPYLFRFEEIKTDSGEVDKKLSWEAVIKPSDNLLERSYMGFSSILQYKGMIYAAAWNYPKAGCIIASESGDSGDWKIVMKRGFGKHITAVLTMAEHDGYLYCGTGDGGRGFNIFRSNDPMKSRSWEQIGDNNFGIGRLAKYAWSLLSRSDEETLYCSAAVFSTFKPFAPREKKGCLLYKSSNGLDWEQIVGADSDTPAGFGNPVTFGIRSSVEINGIVYLGTAASPIRGQVDGTGCEIWKIVD